MLATIIFILILLAGYHFVVESLIVPVLRMQVRNQLIRLRDDLIYYKIQSNEINHKTFTDLNVLISTTANHLDKISLFNFIFRTKRVELDKHRETEKEILSFQKNEETKRIFEWTMNSFMKAALVNSFAWILYISPIFIVILFGVFCLRQFAKFKIFIKKLFRVEEALIIMSNVGYYETTIPVENNNSYLSNTVHKKKNDRHRYA
jgi:hypothetical protein